MNRNVDEIMSALKENDVDLKTTLDRFVDDEDLYCDCLYAFVDDENFTLLKDCLDKKDYTGAFEAAHSLKGVSANLGLEFLTKAVSEIVEPLRSSDYSNLDAQYNEIVVQLNKFRKIIY